MYMFVVNFVFENSSEICIGISEILKKWIGIRIGTPLIGIGDVKNALQFNIPGIWEKYGEQGNMSHLSSLCWNFNH